MRKPSPPTLPFLVFLLVACAGAWARIGESRKACDARYGEPVRTSENGTLVTYKYRSQSVVVHFTDEVADMVSHSRLPPIAGEPSPPFNPAQLDDLMKGNGGKRVWVAEADRPYGRGWRTEDLQLYAILDRGGTHLMFYTAAFAERNAGS